MSEQPDAQGDDDTEEQDQKDPSGGPDEGIGRQKQGGHESREHAGDLLCELLQIDIHG